jgi:hypothetical protein
MVEEPAVARGRANVDAVEDRRERAGRDRALGRDAEQADRAADARPAPLDRCDARGRGSRGEVRQGTSHSGIPNVDVPGLAAAVAAAQQQVQHDAAGPRRRR